MTGGEQVGFSRASEVLSLPPVPPPEAVIWRYVDLAKLVSMMHSSTLHFSRIDQFADQYEGVFARKTIDTLLRAAAQVGAYAPENPGPATHEFQRHAMAAFSLLTRKIRKGTFANCWHASEYESAAMWNLYADRGIAIRSTVIRLARSLRTQEHEIQIRKVLYADHDTDEINESLIFLYKKPFFRHEQEIRAYFLNLEPPATDQNQPPHPRGIPIHCDLSELITEIRLSPRSTVWFAEAVRSVLNRYGLGGVSVQQSEADAGPPYLTDNGAEVEFQDLTAWSRDLIERIIPFIAQQQHKR